MQDAFHSGVHGAGQLRRGFVEFLMLPIIITGAFCAAAIVVSVLDGGAGASPPRRLAEMILSPANATAFVTAVATSLMTVTSITFSVLLVAVQQTATSLSAVVFDQYLQRRSNQAYFGYFVGATAFCVIV